MPELIKDLPADAELLEEGNLPATGEQDYGSLEGTLRALTGERAQAAVTAAEIIPGVGTLASPVNFVQHLGATAFALKDGEMARAGFNVLQAAVDVGQFAGDLIPFAGQAADAAGAALEGLEYLCLGGDKPRPALSPDMAVAA